MKILQTLVNMLMAIVFIAFCAVVLTFFLTIFMRENVALAIEFFKNLLI